MVGNGAPGGPSFPYDANCILKSDNRLSATRVMMLPLSMMRPPSRYVRQPRLMNFSFDEINPLDPSGPKEDTWFTCFQFRARRARIRFSIFFPIWYDPPELASKKPFRVQEIGRYFSVEKRSSFTPSEMDWNFGLALGSALSHSVRKMRHYAVCITDRRK